MYSLFQESLEFVVDKYYDVKYAIRHFFCWIVKSFQYSWFLWDDGDYDYSCILRLLKYKLKRTREHIVKHKMHSEWKQIKCQIAKAEMFISMIEENDFCKQEHKWLDRKWGKIKFKKLKDGMSEMLRGKVKTKEQEIAERKDIISVARLEQKRYKQCLHELFSHIEKNIDNWWD